MSHVGDEEAYRSVPMLQYWKLLFSTVYLYVYLCVCVYVQVNKATSAALAAN